MAHEIERKYLVNEELWGQVSKDKSEYIQQLYLHSDVQKAIRVRIIGIKAYITVKSKVTNLKRLEFEYEIPLSDAEQIFKAFADSPQVEKTRYFIPEEHHTWEVDVFHGKNDGLILAEIELSHEDELFALPEWVAQEVTDDDRYLNANLAK